MEQQIPMTDKERFDMYMKLTKKELASMLIENNELFDRVTKHIVVTDIPASTTNFELPKDYKDSIDENNWRKGLNY